MLYYCETLSKIILVFNHRTNTLNLHQVYSQGDLDKSSKIVRTLRQRKYNQIVDDKINIANNQNLVPVHHKKIWDVLVI